MDITEELQNTIHPKVQHALISEYGSLQNALTHFKRRFKEYAPRIMAEMHPDYFDPIVIKHLNGKEYLNFFDEHMMKPWSITQPRPGSMTELLIKYKILVPVKDSFKLDLSFARGKEEQQAS